MPLTRLPTARIAVVTPSEAARARMAGLLADASNTIAWHRSVDDLIAAGRPDIVIMSRDTVCDDALGLRRIRQRWQTCTLIVTGARSEQDAEQLLNLGADNAMIASDRLLASRLRAAARRVRAINRESRTVVGDIIYDRESRRVWCAGEEVRLTRTEEALFDCLFWHAPDPVSIAELTAFAWGRSTHTERRNLVHVYMGYLRNKFRGSQQVVIRTRRGVGYEFAARQSTSSVP